MNIMHSSALENNELQDLCRHLEIDAGGDSARRKLAEWVAVNRPKWPPVPMPQS
jgi:hypothetical protein